MGYFGKHTLADCANLDRTISPKIHAVRAAFSRVRPAWEKENIFASEKFNRDAQRLSERWYDARRAARAVRAVKAGGAAMTPAEGAYQKMIRAVRQGGMHAEVKEGDLSEMRRRLGSALGRYAGIRREAVRFAGDSAWSWTDAVPGISLVRAAEAWAGGLKNLKDCQDLVNNYQHSLPTIGANFDKIQPAWRAKDGAAVDQFYKDLARAQNDWKSAVDAVTPALQEFGPDETRPAEDWWTALNAAAQETDALRLTLNQAAASLGQVANLAPMPAPVAPLQQERDTFTKKTDPKTGEWWAHPFDNPWVQGTLIVAGIGVIGYTLGQVRFFLPSSGGGAAR